MGFTSGEKAMPLLKFDLIQGRNPQQIQALLDAAHSAMVEAFGVPESDRYQCVTQHQPGEMILKDTGLGFLRTKDIVLVTVISRPRTETQKQNFFRLLAERLKTQCGLSPDDLMISMVINSDADWSFGRGKAQFLTGEL
jgi:malonate semialdehyde decarboxylase